MTKLMGGGRYVLGERLGVGGMGVVYAAEDLARTERVAVKLAHADTVAAELVALHMARELRIGRTIRHRNVVEILDGGSEAGQPYIVMELVTGQPLAGVAAEGLSIRRVGTIVGQILEGLAAIHAANCIHGDVKTDNVVVARMADGSDLVKLIDLGLVCEQGQARLEPVPVISGTPQYLAPECVCGGAKTVASEVYAAGVILYELLTGTTPFAGATAAEILTRQIEDEVTPPSRRCPELRLALSLEDVVMRALRKDPRERYASAAEFRAALQRATAHALDIPTAACAFSTTSPTLGWTRPALPPRRLARGTTPRSLEGRNPVEIVEVALEAAPRQVGDRHFAAALHELESALGLLAQHPTGDQVAWRVLLTQAAITDLRGDHVRARRVARLALDSAARAGSEPGRARAKALLERFAGAARRANLARE